MKKFSLQGIVPPIPTPVTGDDSIDVSATKALVDYLLKGGIDGLMPLGGTGEYGSLAREERVRMVATCVEAVDGKVPVMPGVLDPGFYDALQAGKAFAGAGANAVMVVTPYYTNPTTLGVRDYFMRYADESPIPILIYEIPYRTRIAVAPEVLHELSRHENIIGMKACNTDMYHFLRVMAGVAESFSVLSGEDSLLPLHVAAGARGAVCVTATLLPRTWQAVYKLASEGQTTKALEMHRNLIPMMELAFGETNPGPLKSVWDLIGIDAPRVLAPLVACGADLQRRLRAELVERLRDEEAFART